MLIGYMRVSTGEQNLDLQRDALDRAGCGRVFDDVCSGRATERAGLDKALDIMRDGDTLVVWKLDRIGRSLPHVVGLVGEHFDLPSHLVVDPDRASLDIRTLGGDRGALGHEGISMSRRY